MFCCLLASSCSRFGSLPCPEAPQVESRSADYNMLSKRFNRAGIAIAMYWMRKSAAAARRKVGRLDEVEKDISTGRLSGCWKSLPFPPGRSSFARCPPRVGVCRACLGRKFSPALSARVIVSCFVVFLVTDEGQTRDEAEVLLCYFSIFPPNPTIRGTLGSVPDAQRRSLAGFRVERRWKDAMDTRPTLTPPSRRGNPKRRRL